MELSTAKEVLAAIGYSAQGTDWDEVIADIQQTHGSTRVGSSMNQLGDAAPLFMKAGNVAHMVDHPDDLRRACIRIKHILDQRTPSENIKLQSDEKSLSLPEIIRQVEYEIDKSERVNRDLGVVNTGYQNLYDPDTRTHTRKAQQIIDDLLSTDQKLNAKAVKALQAILIIKRVQAC